MSRMRRAVSVLTAGVLALGISVTVGARDAGAVDASAPFTNVFNQNVNGAIISFGNSLLTCPDTAGDPCRQARAGAKWDNNSFRMVNLDADGDSSTFNSSRSDLVLPDGAQVLFAHLYWGARLTAGTTTGETHPGDPTLAHKMKLKVPGASAYTDIDGRLIAQNNGQNGAYHAVYDVTDLVKAAGTGEYWGANVQAGTGLDRYAGWSITVAYSAPGLPLRNLTVYEGFNTVGSGSPQTVTVTDFLAPLDGLVDAQLSMVAYEGDLAQTSDYTQLNSTQLATAVSPGSNFFDSVNSLAGGYVETKYPAYQNMLGFDIKNLGISGAIKNGDTRAAFSFRTGGDVYYPGVLALAINLFAPDFTSSTKTAVNLSSSDGAFPGDTLQYTLTYTNTGQDRSEKTRSCDPLPAEVDYIPGSLYLLSAPAGTTTEQLPLLLPDDGSKFGVYSDGEVCVNLGVGAGRGGDAQAGGTLKVSDSTSYQFQVKIKAGAGGQTVRNIANLPYVTGTTGTPAIYYTPPVATPVGPKADVKIEKAMSADDPLPGQVGAIAGQPGTTTLTVTNDGPSVAEGVTVTDPLPTDYVATAVNWYANGDSGDCGLPALGGQVVCNLPNLANEAVAIISIKGYPKSESLATTLANTASVTTTTFDPNLSNNVDTVSLPMVHEADLKIAKTPTPQQVVPGQTVTWTLTVTNKCDRNTSPPSGCLSDAMGVTISDTVLDPTKLILTGASDAGGDLAMTCPASSFSASGFQCVAADAVGRLGPGQTAAVEVTGYLRAEATSGAFRNQAAVTSGTFDPDQTDNITTATVTPGTPNSIIALTKTGPATAVAGTRVDYTITAQNEGPSDASGVVVTDTLPQALTVDSLTKATSDRGGDCSIDGRVVTCDLGSLPGPAAPGGAGAIATIKITGALLPADAALDSTFTNSGVTVSCAAGTCAPDPDDPPSVTTTVETQADLAVAKTADQSHVPALDDEVTYTITVTNNGPSNAQAVVLEDAMPQDMTAVSATVAGGEPDACTIGPTDPNVSCALGELAVGASVQVQVVGRAGPNVPEGATQTAEVESGTDDPDDGNNSAKWVHSGSDQADLALTKTSSQDFVAGADSSYYTIRVRNNGPDQADDVVVTDVLPDGLTLTDPVTNTPLLPSECAYNADERQLTCQLGDLQMGRSWGVALYVKVANDLAEGQVLTNLAVAGSTTSDPTTDNNGDMTVDLVKTQTDVEIDYQILYPDPDADAENPCANATASPPPSGVYPPWDGPAYNGPGSLRCAVIEVKNMGLSNARNVKVRSNVVITALPDIPSLPPGCQAVNQEIVCDLNNVMADGLPAFPNGLEPGESMKFPFPFAISPGTDSPANYPDCGRAATCPGSAGGWASASTTTAEADTANNYDTAGLNITGALTYPQMTKRALTTIPNPNGDTHDTYIAGQKFGYEIEFWIRPVTTKPKSSPTWSRTRPR